MMNHKFFTICIILSLINCVMVAQEDVTVESTADTTVEKYDKMLKYFILDKTEVKQLFKTDLFQLALKRPNISYERKISKKTSVEFEALGTVFYNTSLYNFNNSFPLYSLFDIASYQKVWYLNISSDLKYYHNIDKRIMKGKNTNGFSANYFSLGLAAHLTFFKDEEFWIDTNGVIKNRLNTGSDNIHNDVQFNFGKYEPRESIYYVKLGYGLQRRIGNFGYVAADLKLGFGTNKYADKLYVMPEGNFKVGFAIQSFRRRK